uniref:Ig-like domain-containing protein n=1 Tax=Seriola dumerili TaxID=41447 RepID=A0A3B4UCK4_SERDU
MKMGEKNLTALSIVQTEVSPWTIQVPSSVKGLPGSCVVIPCTFNYPDPDKKITKFTGIWFKASGEIIYHPVESKIMQQYRSRTELLGDVTQRNCSLKIDPLQQTDQGPFYFRIEIADYNNFSFKENRLSCHSLTDPEVVEGQTEVASCSVFPSCPTSPPVFNWSHSGEQIQSPQFDDGQWKVTANLTFRPTYADHNKPLLCTVTYKGGRKQEAAKVLKVKRKCVHCTVLPSTQKDEASRALCSSVCYVSKQSTKCNDKEDHSYFNTYNRRPTHNCITCPYRCP